MPYNGKKVFLCILDGFSIGSKDDPSNAVALADMPNLDRILSQNPYTMLETSGLYVGLDEGQMGNSEVGHATIGSGQVIMQDLPMINQAIKHNGIRNSQAIQDAIHSAKKTQSNVHVIGMYSDGGVHSHALHIQHMSSIFAAHNIPVKLHIWTDGRDVPPNQFKQHDCKKLIKFIESDNNISLASICGRYYAMDRDKKWDRTKLATDAIIFATAPKFANINEVTAEARGDEFITPYVHESYCGIQEGDILIFCNFRADRMRQILKVFTEHEKIYDSLPQTHKICMMKYYDGLENKANILVEKNIANTSIAGIYSGLGLKQLKIAETEKYAHVTFFFNGLGDAQLPGEDRILVPSPSISTYDLKPEMSAFEVKQHIIDAISQQNHHLIVANIANGDMVGHTGNINACIKAAEVIDDLLGDFCKISAENDYTFIITADHGNIEQMVDSNGEKHTQHTLNPVPFIICDSKLDIKNLKSGGCLANIAPTILKICDIELPKEMHEPLF